MFFQCYTHPEFAMIRSTTTADTTALLTLAEASGLFESEQVGELSEMLSDYFDSENHDDRFWLTDDDNSVVGVAYCELERMTEGTWNLQLIAIHPDRQGQGRGKQLLREVEQAVTQRSGRVLLVETSGMPDFDRVRSFYDHCGYAAEARIRGFYKAGDDKIVYRKALTA
jgi:ribosomal protein S18 acetylase RimI-like enzyme